MVMSQVFTPPCMNVPRQVTQNIQLTLMFNAKPAAEDIALCPIFVYLRNEWKFLQPSSLPFRFVALTGPLLGGASSKGRCRPFLSVEVDCHLN